MERTLIATTSAIEFPEKKRKEKKRKETLVIYVLLA